MTDAESFERTNQENYGLRISSKKLHPYLGLHTEPECAICESLRKESPSYFIEDEEEI